MKRKLTAAIGVAAMAAGLAACGSDDGGSGGSGSGDAGGSLTVWLMQGSAPDAWLEELNAEFEKEHGVKVNVEIQQWTGIQETITTGLSEDGTVDVLELGNTQTPGFANTGGLADLTDSRGELGYDERYEGNLASVEFDGQLYAVPWYTANRAVVYDIDIWEEAGVTELPTTRAEWIAALETIEANTDAEPIYLPGQSWALLSTFIWDEGGDYAVQNGDEWEGALSTPEAEAGVAFYKELQSFSTSPTDNDEASPQQATEVIPQSEVASWIGLPWEVDGAVAALEEAGRSANLGVFPIPGKTADVPGSVFLGGSNLAISNRAGNSEMAHAWLKLATSEEWMRQFTETTPMLPNRASAVPELEPGSFLEAMNAAADYGNLPPLTPRWANAETVPNPITEMMTRVLDGEDYATVAAETDAEITARINRE